jgi:CHAD domain-containing protein
VTAAPWITEGATAWRRVGRALREAGVTLAPDGEAVVELLDTADGALARAGLLLARGGGRWELWDARGDRAAWGADRRAAAPDAVRKRIKGLIGVNPLAPWRSLTRCDLRGVGGDGVEVAARRWTVDRPGLPSPIRLEVRVEGDRIAAAALRRKLAAAGCRVAKRSERAAVPAIARSAGLAGRGKAVSLDADAPAAAALACVTGPLIDRMRAEEAGVLADADPEHLHAWRVALRSLRAVVSTLRDAAPRRSGKALRARLRALQAVTGPLRDLDVLRAQLEAWTKDPAIAPSADALWAWWTAARTDAKARTEALLRDRAYERALARGRTFLVKGPRGREARAPIGPWIRLLIHRAWTELLEEGAAIDDASADEALHELRKSGKRLRYLLEHFGALLPSGPVKQTTRLLKGLQDVLGAFQDEAVEAESWRAACAAVPELGSVAHVESALAARHAATRARFASAFHELADASPELRAAVCAGRDPEG